jgi:hypothetical protein
VSSDNNKNNVPPRRLFQRPAKPLDHPVGLGRLWPTAEAEEAFYANLNTIDMVA